MQNLHKILAPGHSRWCNAFKVIARTAVQNQHSIPSKWCYCACLPLSCLWRLWRQFQGFHALHSLEFWNQQVMVSRLKVIFYTVKEEFYVVSKFDNCMHTKISVGIEHNERTVRNNSPDPSRNSPSREVNGIRVSAWANRSLAFSKLPGAWSSTKIKEL